MKTFPFFELLERIDQMIRQEKTGDSFEFSTRLGLSRRQLYYYLDEMKEIGLPILYDRKNKTFYYEKQCRLRIHVSITELEDSEERILFGGMKMKKNGLCNRIAQQQCNFKITNLDIYILQKDVLQSMFV
jgi:predicted DNA-binding transcriptional regulator YafY